MKLTLKEHSTRFVIQDQFPHWLIEATESVIYNFRETFLKLECKKNISNDVFFFKICT